MDDADLDDDDRKAITSAISDMSVSDVRKALLMTRNQWANHSARQPIRLSRCLFSGETVETFALKFVIGQHQKRHLKTKVKP